MGALSPEEQKVFDALVAKVNSPVVEKLFNDAGDVLEYLVQHFPGFTADPDNRQAAIDAVRVTFPKKSESASDETAS